MLASVECSACPVCKMPLESNRAQGTCPACMLELGVKTEANRSSRKMPDIEVVRKAFPQLEIIEPLGHGGMSAVYKARQPKLDRFVALKILLLDLAAKPMFADRFEREGKILARLHHPNIVSVHDFGHTETVDDEDHPIEFFYLLLEYVDGVNLRQAMREERFTPEQTLTVIPKICEVLHYAHEEGVLHRDIKPENILIDTVGRIKIADFGIGKRVLPEESPQEPLDRENETADGLTSGGAVLGTLNYMAPEQYDAPESVDHRADIYSLGVIFYELLTGELPVGHFALPSKKTPVGSVIDGIVMKALEANREQRHQSAKEIVTEIEEIKPSGQRPHRPESTHRIAVVSFLFLLVAMAMFLAGPYFDRLYHAEEIRAETEYRLCQNEWEIVDANVQYARNILKRNTQWPEDTGQGGTDIVRSTRLAKLETLLKTNERWLQRRKMEVDAAEQKLNQLKTGYNPLSRGAYYAVMWSPCGLTVLSFLGGLIVLRRIRNDDEKSGVLQAGLSVILSSQLFLIFTISLFLRFVRN